MILEKKDSPKIDPRNLPKELRPLAERAREVIGLRSVYRAALREISTKLEVLDDEFHVNHDYNPIHHMECRVKSMDSIAEKMIRKNVEKTVEGIKTLTDIAGVRVICNYISDIYSIADMLLRQDDIQLIQRKDYIAAPKESGYRSLHLVVTVPVFLSSKTEIVPVEIQIRTIAMDTWASLEHELKYKNDGVLTEESVGELRACAWAMSDVDERMERIHKKVIKGKRDE